MIDILISLTIIGLVCFGVSSCQDHAAERYEEASNRCLDKGGEVWNARRSSVTICLKPGSVISLGGEDE